MGSDFAHLRVEEHVGYWVIVLDRAEASSSESVNTLSTEMLAELEIVVGEAERREDVSALILTGALGKGFAVGADLRQVHRLTPGEAFAFSRRGQLLFGRLERARPLVIAAIDGYCLGGGLDLALACDLRYATRRSVFSHPGARRGLLTGWGGTARLPRAIGRAAALQLFLTAESISAAEALRLGLIHRLVDGEGQQVLRLACHVAEMAARRGVQEVAQLKALFSWGARL